MRALCLADREEMLQVLRGRRADVYDESWAPRPSAAGPDRTGLGHPGRLIMYDYVIVGPVPAVCVPALLLPADPSIRVLLLEAGGRDGSPFIHPPAMMGF